MHEGVLQGETNAWPQMNKRLYMKIENESNEEVMSTIWWFLVLCPYSLCMWRGKTLQTPGILFIIKLYCSGGKSVQGGH